MISYLSGKILLLHDKFIIVEVNNIGYKVFLSRQTQLKLPKTGSDIKLFCFHNIKEEASDLYGFFTYDELDFFEVLMDIRGVGPKAALELSVLGPLDKIKQRILDQDESVFAGIPGIGSKKAMTIILELTGKINAMPKAKHNVDEAESALVALGFSKQQAKGALEGVSGKTTEERVKIALKNLGR